MEWSLRSPQRRADVRAVSLADSGQPRRRLGVVALCASLAAPGAYAFDIAGWSCEGSCGVLGADGNVTLAPGGSAQYGWVSNVNGVTGLGVDGDGRAGNVGPSDGSRLLSPVFPATAGTSLRFLFNFVTSDGDVFSDYAWVRLLDGAGNPVATLFTARSTDGVGNTVPAIGMPPPQATLNPPASVTLTSPPPDPGPLWSPLATDSGGCWRDGCGYTGWIEATYAIPADGSYRLEFGVVNWNVYDDPPFDTEFDSGLAFDRVTLDGLPIGAGGQPIPSLGAFGLGALGVLVGLAGARRLRRRR